MTPLDRARAAFPCSHNCHLDDRHTPHVRGHAAGCDAYMNHRIAAVIAEAERDAIERTKAEMKSSVETKR